MNNARLFVFDVESIGLYGEGFAAAFVVVDPDGAEIDSGTYVCSPERARGSEKDRAWIMAHVAPHLGRALYAHPSDVRYAFWKAMQHWKEQGALIFADCAVPVEAKFLADRYKDVFPPSPFDGPYPLHEVATVLLCAGLDPLATYQRLPSELPVHDPLCDARQSARLLVEALREIQEGGTGGLGKMSGYLGNINGPGCDPDTA